MADELDDTSRMTGEQAAGHKRMSWITVGLIVVASIVLGFAFVLESVPLAIVGGLFGLAGVITGVTGKIMEDVH